MAEHQRFSDPTDLTAMATSAESDAEVLAASSSSSAATASSTGTLIERSLSGDSAAGLDSVKPMHVGDKRLRVKHKSDQRIKLSRSKSGNAKDVENAIEKNSSSSAASDGGREGKECSQSEFANDSIAIGRAFSANSLVAKSKPRLTGRSSNTASSSLDSLDLEPSKQQQYQEEQSNPSPASNAPRNPWDLTSSAGSLTEEKSLPASSVSSSLPSSSSLSSATDTVSILDYILDKISNDETHRDSLTLFNSIVDFELTGDLATQAMATDTASPINLPTISASASSSLANSATSAATLFATAPVQFQQTSSTSVAAARSQASVMLSGRHRDAKNTTASARLTHEASDATTTHNTANVNGATIVGGQRPAQPTNNSASHLPPSTASPPLSPRESRVRKLEEGSSLSSKEDAYAMVQKLCKYATEGDIVGLKKILIHYPFLAHHKNFRGMRVLLCFSYCFCFCNSLSFSLHRFLVVLRFIPF
jgi:hypothetical protein